MKSQEEIAGHIRTLIEEISLGERSADSIEGSHRLIADLGLDSLDYATVLLGCARQLGVSVREEGVDWSALGTVDQLASFLQSQQS